MNSLLNRHKHQQPVRPDGGFLLLHIPIFVLFFLLPAVVAASGGLILLFGILVLRNDGIELDQFISENYELRRCMREIRDKNDYSNSMDIPCPYYAEVHLDSLAFGKKSPATEACALSLSLREYHRLHYHITTKDEHYYSQAIQKDCSHPDVQEPLLRASLSVLRINNYALVLQEFRKIKAIDKKN